MAGNLPSVLMDFNVLMNDKSYAGLANKLTLPKVVMKTIDVEGAGIAGSMKRDTGRLEAMEMNLDVSDCSDSLMSLIGSRTTRDKVLILRGAVDQNGVVKSCVIEVAGYWRELDLGEWAAGGQEFMTKFTVDVEYFSLQLDDKPLFKIDKINNEFIGPDGEDRNLAIREALSK
ncbi:phage major tail tube protein [Veronia pacifica]|uniref:Phage major tail tube protein n=1 Tax=Veronia pacifica TaxID=1080227 RepID=A0A1C3EBQ2_9GAMM|nr:phage major tail tube protein [Veronia pacifica]ODA30630.1 hypothetical protein A8L45_19695 [Veronia pacifica]